MATTKFVIEKINNMKTTKFVIQKIFATFILIFLIMMLFVMDFDSEPNLITKLLPILGFIYLIYSTVKVKKGEEITKSRRMASIILVIIELFILTYYIIGTF